MINLGILDFDTSHCVEFTKRLNHVGCPTGQWVTGATVTLGCPGASKIAPEQIPIYKKEMEKLGVRLVDRPADMIGRVDGMLVESVGGNAHLGRARPFLEAGIPCFIDKPFTCSVAEARELSQLAKKHGVPIFSSSSLRFAPDVAKFAADARHGKILGVFAYGPAPLHPENPGLFHYGIHTVEILYTLMGPGCLHVTATHDEGADVITGHWRDGRIATIRGIRDSPSPYGFTAFTEHSIQATTINTSTIYRELLTKIVEMFTTRQSPLAIAVTIEIVAFIEAANKSAANHGIVQKVEP